MTISGGEPLIQARFTTALLRAARARGIHTALDTSGLAPPEVLDAVMEHVDLVLYDVKHIDSARHEAVTGVPNERILKNLERLVQAGRPVWVRIPLIPGRNDDQAALAGLGRYLAGLRGIERVEILRYHRLAEAKYERMGQPYPLAGTQAVSVEAAEAHRQVLRDCGLSCVICP